MADERAAALAEALEAVNRALHSHAGSVEAVGMTDGVARLRYTGMCAGCSFRPLTTHATVRPLLREQFGIEVESIGSRISAEAEERLTRAYAGTGLCPAVLPRGSRQIADRSIGDR